LVEKNQQMNDLILLKEKLDFIIKKGDEKLIRILYAVAKEYSKNDTAIPSNIPQSSKNLYRMVYTSARSKNCNDDEIKKILEASQRNNKLIGVTGVLIHTQDRFLQVLEGEKDTIMKVYEKIDKDKRHGGSMIRFFEPVEERHFGDWNMAGKKMDTEEVDYQSTISQEKKDLYRSMLNGDIHSYKDDGMRILKVFLRFS
jgi:cation transport regulator ChaB